jgi:Holliday junction resolvase
MIIFAMREKQIENIIKKYLASKGVWYIKHHANKFTKVGVPDILACWQGKFVAIEVKTPVGVLSELQKYNLKAISDAGGISIVARCLEDVEEVIK